jgi:hypothetical protein
MDPNGEVTFAKARSEPPVVTAVSADSQYQRTLRGMRAPINQKSGRKMPMTNITQ